jgi:TRAP transporter TAXI family solute receptor
MRRRSFLSVFLCFVLLVIAASAGQGHAKEIRLTLSPCTLGGTWYVIAVGMASLITEKLKGEGITMSAQSSACTVENINMLREKESDLGMLIGFLGRQAWDGTGVFQGRPFKGMRSVLAMQPNIRHDVLLADKAKTGNFADFEGMHINMSAAGSGAEQAAKVILDALKIKIKPEYLGYSQAAEAIKDRRIDGGVFTAVPPVPAVMDLFASPTKVVILSFTQQQLDQINASVNAWIMTTIPANTYSGQAKPIQTLGEPTFIACRTDLEADLVYKILKTLYANLDEMAKVHAQGRTFFQKIEGLPIPLHPGAIRFWKEQGLSIPDYLLKQP